MLSAIEAKIVSQIYCGLTHICHYDSKHYGRQYSPYNILYVCQWGAHVMTRFPQAPNPLLGIGHFGLL